MVSFPRLLHNLHHRGISNKREPAIVARKAMSMIEMGVLATVSAMTAQKC